MKIRLRVRESPRSSFDWEHAGPALCIGRAEDCQLVFRGSIGEIVSLKHLRIELSPAGATVSDLGSTNGSYLNGAPLTALAPLGVGDHLQLGLAGPRLEVLSLDLQAIRRPPRFRWPVPARPTLIAAGSGAAALVCLIAIFVALRRPTDSPGTKVASIGSTAAENTKASSERSADKAAQRDVKRETNAPPPESATADAGQGDAESAVGTAPALSQSAAAQPTAAKPTEKPSMPSEQPEKQPVDGPVGELPAAEDIAVLTSEHEILLRAVDDEWLRVPLGGPIYAGERLMALPYYRPRVTLGNGLTVQLVGGTIVSFNAAADAAAAKIALVSGRIVLPKAAGPARAIQLQAGDDQGTVEFGDGKATLAVEVRRLLPDGSDPEQEAASTAVDLYLSSGEATWIDEQGRREKLSSPEHRSVGSRRAPKQSADKAPAWVESGELNPTERSAAAELDHALKPDEPVAAALKKGAGRRLLENSVLTVQSLALIDDFEPLVPMLNDARYRTLWAPKIEGLRTALARGPETAALVRVAFASVRGKEWGDQLYRMLWGYTSRQLEDGALTQLVDWLGAADEQMDFRVLSFWNLHRATGLRLNYQPTAPEKQRRASILRWKQKLESGLLAP